MFANHRQQPVLLREPLKRACGWFIWLHVGGPRPPEIERIETPATYLLEIQTRHASDDPIRHLPLAADKVMKTAHFTLYRLSSERQWQPVSQRAGDRIAMDALIQCGDVIVRR